MNKTPTRPALRYYGGKWKLSDWIISHFPSPQEYKTYVESFGGAMSALLKKPPSRVEIYNDMSQEIVNLFRVLRDREQSAELRRLLDLTPYSRAEWLSCYALSSDPVEQASRTIVLAAMSHNPSKALTRKSNGFRSSSAGHHRLPQDFRAYTKALSEITARLKEVVIECRDYRSIMTQHDSPTTLHYLDPPYLGNLRADSRNTYQHELFTQKDHEALADFAKTMKGFVVLSGYESPKYMDWYGESGWSSFSTQAVTGSAVKGKSKRTEVLWLNPKAAAAITQKTLFQ